VCEVSFARAVRGGSINVLSPLLISFNLLLDAGGVTLECGGVVSQAPPLDEADCVKIVSDTITEDDRFVVEIRDLNVRNAPEDNFEISQPYTHCTLKHCSFTAAGDDGVVLDGDIYSDGAVGTVLVLEHCDLSNNGDDGLYDDTDLALIRAYHSTFNNNDGDGFDVNDEPADVKLVHCEINDNDDDGIEADNGEFVRMELFATEIRRNGERAIEVETNMQLSLKACTLEGTGGTPGNRGGDDEDTTSNIGLFLDPEESGDFAYVKIDGCTFSDFRVAILDREDDEPKTNVVIRDTLIEDCDVGIYLGEGDLPTPSTRETGELAETPLQMASYLLERVTIKDIFYAGILFDEAENFVVELKLCVVASPVGPGNEGRAILFEDSDEEDQTKLNTVILKRSCVGGVVNLGESTNVVRGRTTSPRSPLCRFRGYRLP